MLYSKGEYRGKVKLTLVDKHFLGKDKHNKDIMRFIFVDISGVNIYWETTLERINHLTIGKEYKARFFVKEILSNNICVITKAEIRSE